MNPVNAFDAITPAWQRMKQMLFGPFNFERWIALGLLCFLQTCAGMGAQSSCNGGAFNIPSNLSGLGNHTGGDKDDQSRFSPPGRFTEPVMYASLASDLPFEDPDTLLERLGEKNGPGEELAEVEHWVKKNVSLVVGLGAVLIVLVLGLTILFQWLGARAAFAYIENLVTGRAEVEGPWKRHAALADSYWRWRLGYIVIVWVVMLALLVPMAVLVYRGLQAPGHDAWIRLFYSGPLWLLMGVLVLAGLTSALIDLGMFDVALPIQYLRRTSAGPAMAEAWQLIRGRIGAFLLYLVLKVLLALAIAIATVVFGFLTCCCGFLLMLVPVIGQAVLQPIWILHRSITLYFLQQFGPTYDVFASPPPPAT
jgi:hypothetical protein